MTGRDYSAENRGVVKMTNEEWLKQLPHKDLINFLCDLQAGGCGCCPFFTRDCTIKLWLLSEHQEGEDD